MYVCQVTFATELAGGTNPQQVTGAFDTTGVNVWVAGPVVTTSAGSTNGEKLSVAMFYCLSTVAWPFPIEVDFTGSFTVLPNSFGAVGLEYNASGAWVHDTDFSTTAAGASASQPTIAGSITTSYANELVIAAAFGFDIAYIEPGGYGSASINGSFTQREPVWTRPSVGGGAVADETGLTSPTATATFTDAAEVAAIIVSGFAVP